MNIWIFSTTIYLSATIINSQTQRTRILDLVNGHGSVPYKINKALLDFVMANTNYFLEQYQQVDESKYSKCALYNILYKNRYILLH